MAKRKYSPDFTPKQIKLIDDAATRRGITPAEVIGEALKAATLPEIIEAEKGEIINDFVKRLCFLANSNQDHKYTGKFNEVLLPAFPKPTSDYLLGYYFGYKNAKAGL